MTLGRELKALDAIYSLGLSMIWANPSHDFKALDAMNNSRKQKTWKTSSHELKPLDSMIISGL